MPRRIDWNLKSKRQLINKDLNKQNAIINAIRVGNVTKAEILSGEELVARDPIQEALVRKQVEKTRAKEASDKEERRADNQEIINRLQAIVDKPAVNNQETLEDIRDLLKLRAQPGKPIPLPAPAGIDPIVVDIDKGLDKKLVKEFGKPSDILREDDDVIVSGIIAQLNDRIRRFNLQGLNTSELTKYRNRLKDVRMQWKFKQALEL